MGNKNIRELEEWITTEDSFGTPPAARGSMMNIAGAEDEIEPGEELLTDDDEENRHIDNTMKGPVYPESVVRMKVSVLRQLLRKTLNS